MNNIAHFPTGVKKIEALRDAIVEVIDDHADGSLTISSIVGVLEVVKFELILHHTESE